MRNNFLRVVVLIMVSLAQSFPVHQRENTYNPLAINKFAHPTAPTDGTIPAQGNEGEVISVRITSSVAVDRGSSHVHHESNNGQRSNINTTQLPDTYIHSEYLTTTKKNTEQYRPLEGANIEFIKQLQAKKEALSLHVLHEDEKPEGDSAIEESATSISMIPLNNEQPYEEDVPLARSVPLPGFDKNRIQDLTKTYSKRRNIPSLTTAVSFNIVHGVSKATPTYNDQSMVFSTPEQFYSEPPKVYSQPAKIYSEPAKFYSKPAKIYSEPAKVYSEPAKIYSEPAKVYSEPAKFYSQPASLHLHPEVTASTWQDRTETPHSSGSTYSTTPEPVANETAAKLDQQAEHQPEKNYEVDEKVSVMTDGRSHGVQENSPENCKEDNCKVGYVVEGRQYRKYRVEERTSDGFIVGEYGVVRQGGGAGAVRGVRYTAAGDASPRLIYDALMKFLQLK